MTVGAVDSAIHRNLCTTPAMRVACAEAARRQRMLDVEAVLARAEAGLAGAFVDRVREEKDLA